VLAAAVESGVWLILLLVLRRDPVWATSVGRLDRAVTVTR
jgi:hypothetical protein